MKQELMGFARSALWTGRRTVAALRNKYVVENTLARFSGPRYLHLGCGTVRFDGWVNVDAEAQSSVDLVWDLRFGIPGADGSAALIYCEHFLEHLSPSDGLKFLAECRRVLKPGGTLRIAMPSLDHILNLVCAGNWSDQQWLREPTCPPVSTRAEMLNLVFRAWGHEWLYDREELERRLNEAGFKKFAFVQRGESSIPEVSVP